MAKINIDLSKVMAESTSLFSKVPAGEYLVSVAHSAFKETSKGGAGLTVGYMIESGEHKGKMVSDFVNIKNESEKAVEIGFQRLRLICELQGRTSFKLVEDKDLISRNQFKIITELEESEYNGKATENVRVKKLMKSDEVASVTTVKKEVKKEEPKEEELITVDKLPWE